MPAGEGPHRNERAKGPWPVKLAVRDLSGGPAVSSEAGGYYPESSEGFPNFRPESQFTNVSPQTVSTTQAGCYSLLESAACELRREGGQGV